ncbi:hypothetical protein PAPYR_9216 [Paratrimastix pyriformis]|uniref:Tyrosine-protein kinase ephrin type A/B receptor-like domain-containing protein n=1 Tax=Paratrimastix pyriformis TaxID=342808 RepID=A0ABQ8U8T9_9EUKA|nr:hypothetical protein PAPYR_9216 [Paratrimastix pyriformis]
MLEAPPTEPDDLWYQVVDTGLWLNSPSIHLPEPRAFAQAIVWQGKIYIIGGYAANNKTAPAAFLALLADGFIPPTSLLLWTPSGSPTLGSRGLFNRSGSRRGLDHWGSYTTNTWIYRLSLSEMVWLEPHRPEGMGILAVSHDALARLVRAICPPYYLLIETRWQPWIPSSISDIPAHRYGAVMFFFGDSVAVFGGQTDNGTTNSLVVRFGVDLNRGLTEETQELESAPPPSVFQHCLAAPLEEERFIVGGCSLPIEDDLDKAECPNSTLYVLSACPAGTRFTNKRCEPCPECAGKCDLGWYSEKPAVNELSCRPSCPCPAGTYSQNGAPSRDACLSCDGALCRLGANSLEMNLTVCFCQAASIPALDDVTGGRIKNFIYYAMGGLVGLVALISLILVLLGIHKSRVARGLHRIDLWPAFVGRVEQFGLPIRNSSALGGPDRHPLLFVVVIGFLARNILDVIPQFNTKRVVLGRGPPAAAQDSPAPRNYTACSLCGTSWHVIVQNVEWCAIVDALFGGLRVDCLAGAPRALRHRAHLEHGQLQPGHIHPTARWVLPDEHEPGVQLLADATITVNVSSATEQVYNGGWWWEIHVDGIDNIHNVTFQNRTLPKCVSGFTSTALKLAMTFTNYTLSYDQWHQRNFQYWNFVQVRKPEVSYPSPRNSVPLFFGPFFKLSTRVKFRDLRFFIRHPKREQSVWISAPTSPLGETRNGSAVDEGNFYSQLNQLSFVLTTFGSYYGQAC